MIVTDDLKAIPITDVWQALGYELRRGNQRCFGVAHTKGDRNPSLGFDSKSNRFKCFACGIQGDTLELVQQAQDVDFRQAAEWLSRAFNVATSSQNGNNAYNYAPTGERPAHAPRTPQLEPLRNANLTYILPDHAATYKAFYEHCEPPNTELRAWWRGRGLSDQLLEAAGWRTITKSTWQKMAADFTGKDLERTGLLIERDGKLRPLFYKHTVIVPFFDDGQLIYMRARSLDPTVKAKYLAPRGTSPPIYNYQALVDYNPVRPLFVTESETDALALMEQGETALALVGGQKHPDSLTVRELVAAIVEGFDRGVKVNIATDRDPTGNAFFEAVAKALYLAGVAPTNLIKWQCPHPEHKDVGDCLREQKRSTKE